MVCVKIGSRNYEFTSTHDMKLAQAMFNSHNDQDCFEASLDAEGIEFYYDF